MVDENNQVAEYKAPYNLTTKTVIVPSSVMINGKKYQVKYISDKAFYKNGKLTAVKIPDSVVSIGNKAFYGCKKLKKLTIGQNTTYIGEKAFYGCKKLKNITIKTSKLTTKTVGKQAFKGIHKKVVVKLPVSKKSQYKKMLKKRGIKF